MPTTHDVQTWPGRTLLDDDGDKIGEISDIYLDRQSGEPEWIAVRTGLLGTNVSFVPLHGASGSDDGVRVPYAKSLVKDAPNVKADGELSPEEERRLYRHYSVDFGDFDHHRDDDADRTPATGRARLRKFVVAENVQTTVPVQREPVRREQIEAEGDAGGRL